MTYLLAFQRTCFRAAPLVIPGILFLTGCATSPIRTGARNLPPEPLRTELVLLNVPEGSGWVAYRQDETEEDVEDFRIVVIRQSTSELIYDSVIPLNASLATHGFELSRNDPRLQSLARNVDQKIIEPLEQMVPPEPTRPAEASTEPDNTVEEPAEVEETEEPEPGSMGPESESVSDTASKDGEEVVSSLYRFLREEEDVLLISFTEEHPLAAGDELFVREPDRTIDLPGTNEQVLVSKGSVTGLVRVESVSSQIARATVLTGYLPEQPHFEASTEE